MGVTLRRGSLSTLGYTEERAMDRVDTFLTQRRSYLVDIRLKPYASRFQPQWNRDALTRRYRGQYIWLKGLGNTNYQHRTLPFHLLDPEPHVRHLAEMLKEGHSYLLLCACKDYTHCHRKLVHDRILVALGEQRELLVPEVVVSRLWAILSREERRESDEIVDWV